MKDYQWNMHSNQAKSLMLARRQLAELVCDAVNLEGLHFTLPEIQTLTDYLPHSTEAYNQPASH